MPDIPLRHAALPSSRPSLGVVLSIALGLWLGLTLTFASGWLIWRYGYGAPPLFAVTVPVTVAAPRVEATPRSAEPAPARSAIPTQPISTDTAPMFDQYQQNLRQQAEREAQACANPANQSNAACQFWLQQAQTAPSDHSREQVAKLCR